MLLIKKACRVISTSMAVVHFLPTKISSTHKKLSAVSSPKWIVSELFNFSNHSNLIAFHILILRGRRWFRSWKYNTNYYSSYYSFVFR